MWLGAIRERVWGKINYEEEMVPSIEALQDTGKGHDMLWEYGNRLLATSRLTHHLNSMDGS